MCSWCYGFRSVRDQVIAHAGPQTRVRYVMGGLAADSNEPMPETMRGYVQEAWRAVAATTGVSFNWDFWSRCTPRRSTYASCRAVIAAGGQGPQLFDRIQRAYYEEARNPSDEETLVACAEDLGLEPSQFQEALHSREVEQALQADLQRRRELGVDSFPSLVYEARGEKTLLARGYATGEEIMLHWPGADQA